MIGRLILSDRNIYKISFQENSKQVSARKCNILSHLNPETLVKTSKEFNTKDEYIKFDPSTNTIIEGLGHVGSKSADLNIYYHLFTLNWKSNSKYSKLWDEYMNENVNFDLANIVGIKRQQYTNQVITIDPEKSIDLDDGFSIMNDNLYYYLDIHIADPVSWFNFENEKFKIIFSEIKKRLQTCYISLTSKPDNPTHLLSSNIINQISLLKVNNDSKIKSRRAISFCFKICKQTKLITEFEIKPTNLLKIENYTYDGYDEYINSNQNIKKKIELINLVNILIDIIELREQTYSKLKLTDNISHKMIEIFMILTNWYSGNYFLKTIKINPILRIQNKKDISEIYDNNESFDINIVPEYARQFLSTSANYIQTNYEIQENPEEYIHYSLGIRNYAHISSPMRRFIDIMNHLKFYYSTKNLLSNLFLELKFDFDFDEINSKIKIQKKISNAWKLIKFIKSNSKCNIFRACLFDWIKDEKNNKIFGLIVLHHQNNNFNAIVNVEIPQIESTLNLSKYIEWDVELYYNSNKFKSTKFPFSIKII